MSPHRLKVVLGLAAIVLLPGCAGAPNVARPPAAAVSECRELDAEISIVEEAKRLAVEKQQGAWKAVIPVAVAAQYGSGKSTAAAADKRIKQLQDDFARQGCAHARRDEAHE